MTGTSNGGNVAARHQPPEALPVLMFAVVGLIASIINKHDRPFGSFSLLTVLRHSFTFLSREPVTKNESSAAHEQLHTMRE